MDLIRRIVIPAMTRVAAGAPARAFVIEGSKPPASLPFLWLQQAVDVVETPRAATLLLVAGTLPPALNASARLVHDQMPRPRITVHWREERASARVAPTLPTLERTVTGEARAVAHELQDLQRQLITGALRSESDELPDVEPAEWRGVGPHGQGGVGMTDGVPYGRPMAETAPDRDGLKLDQLRVRIGPFTTPLPVGLTLALKLQGDIIQEVVVEDNPFRTEPGGTPGNIFQRAVRERVRIADLEVARARHHLVWLASFLRMYGLRALAARAVGLAETVSIASAGRIAAFGQLLERTHALASTKHIGVMPPDAVRGRGLGPVERAVGIAADERANDDVYRTLGFEALTQREGDVRARWRQRVGEAEQAIELAARAQDASVGARGRVESPRGLLTSTATPLSALLWLLTATLPGMEWGDAVSFVASLDIDLRDVVALNAAVEKTGTAA